MAHDHQPTPDLRIIWSIVAGRAGAGGSATRWGLGLRTPTPRDERACPGPLAWASLPFSGVPCRHCVSEDVRRRFRWQRFSRRFGSGCAWTEREHRAAKRVQPAGIAGDGFRPLTGFSQKKKLPHHCHSPSRRVSLTETVHRFGVAPRNLTHGKRANDAGRIGATPPCAMVNAEVSTLSRRGSRKSLLTSRTPS